MNSGTLNIPTKDLYLLVGDERQGPFQLEDLERKFSEKQITRATFLWYPGLVNWVTVGDIPQFNQRAVVAVPENARPVATSNREEVWTYENLKVVGQTVEALRLKIKENAYRRGDLIFLEPESKWVRADQHPLFTEMFAAPVPPPETQVEKVDAAPTPAAPRKVNTWVYQGVGFACLVAALSAWFLRAPSPNERVPASVQKVEAPAKIHLGMPVEVFYSHPGFVLCSATTPAGKYRCGEIEPGLTGLWLEFKQDRLFQLEGRFAPNESGKAALAKWSSDWGTPQVRAVNCATLSGAQEAQYGAFCKAGDLRVQEWRTKDIWARCLTAGPTPLEIKVVQTHQ